MVDFLALPLKCKIGMIKQVAIFQFILILHYVALRYLILHYVALRYLLVVKCIWYKMLADMTGKTQMVNS